MKQNLIFIICAWLLGLSLMAQTATKPQGEGNESHPYQIANWQNLYWMSQNTDMWDKHYSQTANIEFPADITEWNYSGGWTPIGERSPNSSLNKPFTGTYDGKGFSISNLFSNTEKEYVGLFGATDQAIIINVRVVDVNLASSVHNRSAYLGALIGHAANSYIFNCFSSGNISGDSFRDRYCGGLIGYSANSIISNSYSIVAITSGDNKASNAGGFIACASDDSQITNCAAFGDVDGVTAGGFCGLVFSSVIENCISTGRVVGHDEYNGGFIGHNEGAIINSFWDTQTSNQVKDIAINIDNIEQGLVGKTSAQMKNLATFTNAGFDFTNVWIHTANNYPVPALKMIPFVVISDATNIKSAEVTANGSVIAANATLLTKMGFVWSKHPNVSMDNNLGSSDQNNSVEDYAHVISGLEGDTKYYIKAYAANANGISYSREMVVSTSALEPLMPLGSGTENAPYKIENIANLYWLGLNPDYWNAHYLQTADIDFSTLNTPLSQWDEGKGWNPVGHESQNFTGSYNGDGYAINALFINRPEQNNIGLFGWAHNATISNVKISNADITGKERVAALVGYFSCDQDYRDDPYSNYQVTHASSTGTINGDYIVGGLVGWLFNATVINSNSKCNVNGNENVGGLVGNSNANVYRSFSNGDVAGIKRVGGLCGDAGGKIINAYSTGKVTRKSGSETSFGSFVGAAVGEIENCYAAGKVAYTGATNPHDKGFAGESFSADFVNNIFVSDLTGQTAALGAEPKTAAELRLEKTIAHWALHLDWTINDHINSGLPTIKDEVVFVGAGTKEDPYLIRNWEELYWLANHELFWFNKNYKQTADIVFPESIVFWNNATGFKPIGHVVSLHEDTPFERCSYNGGFHTIKNLYINKQGNDFTEDRNVGLFGLIEQSEIKNLGLIEANVTGYSNVGALVGQGKGDANSLSNCYATGVVQLNSESSNFAGGLIGNDEASTIKNCYSTCAVRGGTMMGVFVGHAGSTKFENCYAAGEVEDGSYNGGFYGYYSAPTFSSCFWDVSTSAQADDNSHIGLTGKTTAQMKQASSFAGWDFDLIWQMGNNDYPTHRRHGRFYGSGTVSDPYLINSWEDLLKISQSSTLWESHFVQTTNITFPDDINNWNEGKGWMPIGESYGLPFKGVYDGAGYVVENLYINQPDNDYVGLFGFTEAATIQYLGAVNANVTGKDGVGALLGYGFRTKIDQCYSTGSVQGGNAVGGLVGAASIMEAGQTWKSDFVNSYSFASVNGNAMIGGFIGVAEMLNISDCYSAGAVTGAAKVGGFMGDVPTFGVTATKCYFDTEKSGQTVSARGTGKNSAQMKTKATYENWNFTNVWSIDEDINGGYPYFDNHVMLTINVQGEGTVHHNQKQYFLNVSYLKGSSVNVSAVPAPGYVFDGWTGDVNSFNENAQIKLDESKTLTATFSMLANTIEARFLVDKDNLKAFPNPCSDYMTISNIDKASMLVVYNIAGNKVMEKQLSGLDTKTIDTSNLDKGIYMVLIQYADKKSETLRFVKK